MLDMKHLLCNNMVDKLKLRHNHKCPTFMFDYNFHFHFLFSCFNEQLLRRNPERRLGSGEKDAEEVKKQPFFRVSILYVGGEEQSLKCLSIEENDMVKDTVDDVLQGCCHL